MAYLDTNTIFRENKKMKKLWQKYCDKHKLDYSEFIRKCIYEKVNLKEIEEGK